MRNYLRSLLLFLISLTITPSICYGADRCDEAHRRTLRHGQSYTFQLDLHSKIKKRGIHGVTCNYIEEYDYNGSNNFPDFSWDPDFKNKNKFILPNTGQDIRVFLANTSYPIKHHPKERSYNNLVLVYDVTYYDEISPDVWNKQPEIFKSCVLYEISWCGDGIIDKEFGETCDDGQKNGIGPCSKQCGK